MAVLRNMARVSGARNTLEKLLRIKGAESNGSVPGGRKLATSMVPSGSTTSRLRTRSAATGAVKWISVMWPQVGIDGDAIERRRDVGGLEVVGHPREAGGEDEALHLEEGVLQGVDELQQERGVRLHAARNVA